MLILLAICSITASTHCSLYDGENYYQFGDEKKADCILAQDMRTYTYLGNRDHTIRGEHCLEWKTVHDSIIKSLDDKPDELQEYQANTVVAEELMPHNKCRRLNLPANHPMRHLMKSSHVGPWCYVQRKKNIEIEKCFLPCRGEPREEKASPDKTQYGAKEVLKNYNDVLIENIRKYYKSYHWGDSSYYRWKPSDSAFSAEYFRIREQIFYGCMGTVIVLILWLITCYYLRRKAAASRRRREEALKDTALETSATKVAKHYKRMNDWRLGEFFHNDPD